MNSTLPLPLRIAAGLVATAVEQVRDLPRTLVELPVTAVSQTLQASMRVQQRVTELAIKGDRALSVLRPAEEKPGWATFDDDEDDRPARPRPRPTGSAVTRLRPPPAAEPESVASAMAEVAAASFADDEVDTTFPVDAVAGLDDVEDAEAIVLIETVEDDVEGDVEGVTALPEPVVEDLSELPLLEYPTMSIAQLRGRLRFLSVTDLQKLLAFETAHEERPPFVTMLTNRISSVSGS